MTKAEIIVFMNANPNCHMATVEGNKPHVRDMRIYRADENGIIIQTSKPKDLHKQLSENPETELCFNDYKEGVQVRVSGRMELVEDMELKQEIAAKRAFVKSWVEEKGYDFIKIYRLSRGQAQVWTMKLNFAPKTYIQL